MHLILPQEINFLLNLITLVSFFMSSGKEFHNKEAWKVNEFVPYVIDLALGISSKLADRRL